MVIRFYGVLGGAVLAAAALTCGGGNTASELAKPPELELEGQTKCQVQASQDSPLIVEWPSADRTQLESEVQSNVAVVRYDGCEMKILPHCKAPGEYSYRGVTPKQDKVSIRDEDELYANIPLYAVKFEGKLKKAGELNVAMTMVGRMETNTPQVDLRQLEGVCDGATHLIAGLTVGAFEFFAGAAAEVGAGVDAKVIGAGAKSVSGREMLTKDGSLEACQQEGDFSAAPPPGCAALLRVEVAPLKGVTSDGGAGTASGAVDAPTLEGANLAKGFAGQPVNGKWETEGDLLFGGGGGFYVLDVPVMRDFTIEVDTEFAHNTRVGRDTQYGLVVRATQEGDYVVGYRLYLVFDQKYQLFSCTGRGGCRVMTEDWEASKGFKPSQLVSSQTNRLRATFKGQRYDYYINGKLVESGSDNAWASGKVALAVGDGMRVKFSNLKVIGTPAPR